ncbi:hypothetical protein JGH11_03310 [Dysgonomonas sp. Marseille-P4677]|uniref:DUF6633 family protein n=1 Tax=Dysgonomonas sp. Marseille-P4677 TaxID=2364790 RepID=UPI0019122C25|nr:DUF6633 family protein [Dysgonomonas sp. Marseille-P4677]MBK5719892.1 hypothetical protein [Dysgonomonas sp. Marseille-P4677]
MIRKNNAKHLTNENQDLQNQINELYNKYGDCDKFAQKFEEIQRVVYAKKEQVFFESSPSLRLLEEAYGYNFILRILSYQLIDINTSTNVKLKMGTPQIKDLSVFFLSDFKDLKISEFLLFIKYCKDAVYGSFYAQVDPHLIKSWFHNNFLADRKDIFDNYRLQKYQQAEAEKKQKKELEREQWRKDSVTRQQYEELVAKGLYKPRYKNE